MSKPAPLSATKCTVLAPRSSAPTRITGRSVLPVNFHAFCSRFCMTMRNRAGSAVTRKPSAMAHSTARPGSIRSRLTAISCAIALRSTGFTLSSVRVTWDSFSRSSMSMPMRWLAARMRASASLPSTSSLSP